MKRLYAALALLAAVVVLCVLTHRYQHHEIDRMLTALEDIETAARRGDLVAAQSKAAAFASDYRRVSDRISCYVSHGELRESRETAAILPALLEQGATEELYKEIRRLQSQLQYLRQVDDPIFRNIL